jgi:hypothetical protein
MDNEIEKDMQLKVEAIIEEIIDLKRDAISQIKNKENPQIIADTFEKIASLTIDLESLKVFIFIPDALTMEKLEKEFFFKERLPRAMKSLKRYHN